MHIMLSNILVDVFTETTLSIIIATAEVQPTTVSEVTTQLMEMTTESALEKTTNQATTTTKLKPGKH